MFDPFQNQYPKFLWKSQFKLIIQTFFSKTNSFISFMTKSLKKFFWDKFTFSLFNFLLHLQLQGQFLLAGLEEQNDPAPALYAVAAPQVSIIKLKTFKLMK